MATVTGSTSGDNPPADGSRYDAIVVGAGHNGLIAAGYLAKAGKKVLVLERRSIIGGATVTEEWFPGYHLATAMRCVPSILNTSFPSPTVRIS
jgi:phytoene dehydrogenase-like protein